MLNLLIDSSSLENVWNNRGVVEWEGRHVQIVSLEDLKEMKLMTNRDRNILALKKFI